MYIVLCRSVIYLMMHSIYLNLDYGLMDRFVLGDLIETPAA